MAVDHGFHYSVEVTSRFALFNVNDEDTENPLPSLASRDDHHNRQGNQKSKNQHGVNPANNRKNKGPLVNSGTGGEAMPEHFKEEHHKRKTERQVPPRRGREFDRKSGSDKTGVKPLPKKDGYGTGNWGTIQDEIEATMTEQNEVVDTSNENIEESAAEPETPTLTLEEYKAMQGNKFVASEEGSSRRPNDGKDVFKNMKLVQPTKSEPEYDQPKFASVYHKVNESGIAISVSSDKPRGGRGGAPRGRGGDRGRRIAPKGAGGDRGDRPPRRDREDEDRPPRKEGGESARGGRPSGRGGSRGAFTPGSRVGAPRGGAGSARGNRGAATEGRGRGGHGGNAPRFNDNDFPALG